MALPSVAAPGVSRCGALRVVDAAEQGGASAFAMHVAQILGRAGQPDEFLQSLAQHGQGRYAAFEDPQQMDLVLLIRVQ